MNRSEIEEDIQRIKRLILKSLLEEASKEEIQELNDWAGESMVRRALFKNLSDKEYLEKSFEQSRIVFKKITSKSKGYSYILKVAAIFLILASSVIFLLNVATKRDYTLHTAKVYLVVGKNKPYQLSDVSDLEKLAKKGVTISSDTIDYSESCYNSKTIHTLYVPKKRTFTVKLSDGSVVKLNSESSLSFTGKFIETARVVTLKGEAYFEIAHNKNFPFVTKTRFQEVLVKGTTFNIKAYPYEKTIRTTLVEGSVQVKLTDSQDIPELTQLEPGFQYIFEKETGIGIVKAVDVNKFISWKDGVYCFESERLEDIMNNISRWYGLTVMFKSDNLKEIVLSGKLRRDESPSTLIKTIDNLSSVEIIKSDNHIIIK